MKTATRNKTAASHSCSAYSVGLVTRPSLTDENQALGAFAAISSLTRLRIVRLLVVAGAGGRSAGVIAEALGVCPAFERLASMPGATFISNEPALTFALDDECRTQCRVNMETRTNAYQIRTGEFHDEQVSVYVTARQYGSLPPDTTYVDVIDRLARLCREVVDGYVVDNVLQPLARAIALE